MGFWDESFWLPENVSWNDLKSNATVLYPDVYDLLSTVKYGGVMLLVRVLIECFIFLPIGHIFGYIDAPQGISNRIVAHLKFGFAGKSKFKRVAETAWRFTFFVFAWFFGLAVMWNEPQLRDVTECWRNWPHHPISAGVWWYYMIETSFYWALLFSSVAFDIRRADFLQMTLHHTVTLLLLYMSFTMNMVRVGTLILFSHDLADIFIELGKLFRYANWQIPLMVLFVVFLILWTLTRLIYFPFWIIYSVLFDAPSLIQSNYRWENLLQRPIVPRILVAMLLCLLLLHIFWTYLIVMIAVNSISGGELDDIREGDETSDEEMKKTTRTSNNVKRGDEKKTQ
uniref:LAG1 longevity assurance 5 n=1 Tax=Ascaris suum TaxID=6253 RepID=F1L7Y6_ASCSU